MYDENDSKFENDIITRNDIIHGKDNVSVKTTLSGVELFMEALLRKWCKTALHGKNDNKFENDIIFKKTSYMVWTLFL